MASVLGFQGVEDLDFCFFFRIPSNVAMHDDIDGETRILSRLACIAWYTSST